MTTPSRPAAAPDIAGRLTALADWMEQRLDDADYDRQAVAESGVTQLRELAALAHDTAASPRRPAAPVRPGADDRTTAAVILRAVADLIDARPDIHLPSIRVHYIFGTAVADAAAVVADVAAALPCQWRADLDGASSGGWLDLEAQTGASALHGAEVMISAKAEALCVATGTKTVTTWEPQPIIAALAGPVPPGGAR